ncbi:MAG: histone deacetylase [Deltaproteobacteria bacterium]|nr:histone deacetylase [Deltaproteobacteria bacterium]
MTTQNTRVGVVRDERYLLHKPGHTHPEHPNRLKAIYRMLDAEFRGDLIAIKPRPATLEHLELVHTPSYVKRILKTADHGYTSLAPDTPASAETYLASWLAVGGCLKALDELVDRSIDACFSLIRPPGHHALKDRAGGFCVFNNAGIAARYAMKAHNLRRILIIDWDIHHGNGINDLFHREKEVLYFSSHDPMLYPYTGDWEDVGEGEGAGYTINIPLPRELEDPEFVYIYQTIVGPLLRSYQPQLILVAAGFDAHEEDPIGRSKLTEAAFNMLTRGLMTGRTDIGDPPILFILEGGYSPRALAACVREVMKALLNGGGPETPSDMKTQRAAGIVAKARRIHEGYGLW